MTISISRSDRCRRRRASSAVRNCARNAGARRRSAAARGLPPARSDERAECGPGARRIEIGRQRHAPPCRAQTALEMVTQLPPSPSENGTMVSEASGVSPRLQASGIGPEHMREIEVADGDAVADVGPGRLAVQRQVDAFACGETQLACATSTALSKSGMKPAVIWCVALMLLRRIRAAPRRSPGSGRFR